MDTPCQRSVWPASSFVQWIVKAAFAAAVVAAVSPVVWAQSVQLKSTPVATGLASPLFVTHAPGDATRLFVVEQRGRIKVINILPNGTYTTNPTPFLDLTPLLGSTYLEYGVLGLAFDPDYASNGFFYVTYTPGASNSNLPWTISRFHVSSDPNVAEYNSRRSIITVTYTITQHRAGWLDFGPDGYLYATTGDGGEGDPSNAASDLGVLRGKVLRIDVRGPDGLPGTADDDDFPADEARNYRIPPTNPFINTPGAQPEIWAYGLRNPWRASFDRATGDLWIGDVGQTTREEVDFQPAGSLGGAFYGWRCIEGTVPTGYAGCPSPLPPSVPPVFDYGRSGTISGSSVTGGYVYRGCAIPSMRGVYIFGDWGGKVWASRKTGATLETPSIKTTELIPAGQSSLGTTVSFGEDALGELYYVVWSSSAGAVYKIEPRTLDGPDCNHNGRADSCDIALRISNDLNRDGIPDECQEHACIADINLSGSVTLQDLFDYLGAYFANCTAPGPGCFASADIDSNGSVSLQDLFGFLNAWFSGC